MVDVSIIIVNYNTRDLTLQCIKSVYEKTEGVSFEIIVVDNASSDDSVCKIREQFPQVVLFVSSVNLGFGRANNWGAKYAKGKYLFLLNSDTIVISNIVRAFFLFMEKNKDFVSCGASLVAQDGANLISHGRFPSLLQEFSEIGFYRFYPRYYRECLSVGQKANEGSVNPVDYISGADIFIRKSFFDEMGGFDERIFMYYEETDLYYRMRQKGYRSCLLPEVRLIHLEGGSFADKKKAVNLSRFQMMFKSKIYFFKKNRSTTCVCFIKIFSFFNLISHFDLYKRNLVAFLLAVLRG